MGIEYHFPSTHTPTSCYCLMSSDSKKLDDQAIADLAGQYRQEDKVFNYWANGFGVVSHSPLTQLHIYNLAYRLQQQNVVSERNVVFRILAAADRITNAALWLVVHMTYARNVYLDGRKLQAEDFKPHPKGQLNYALDMVPAYVGYFAANSLTSITRSWLSGLGSSVAAIDAVNLLLNNMPPDLAERYQLNNDGLSLFTQDYFSPEIQADGRPSSPLGSHVSPNTAGAIMEGTYPGLAELQYVHMPLPGERMVAFLSDCAFEEQRGFDWAPHWWRFEDCGLVTPIMISNGKGSHPHTAMYPEGKVTWFRRHLELNNFIPTHIDGHDPASFAWGIIEMEEVLLQATTNLQSGKAIYPVRMPYGIAESVNGFAFDDAIQVVDLSLEGLPNIDSAARKEFNKIAGSLWVKFSELDESIRGLSLQRIQNRPKEYQHALAMRDVPFPVLPEPPWKQSKTIAPASPMDGIDGYFCAIINANPQLRPRVGDPGVISGTHLNKTLDLLKYRVTPPYAGTAEALEGCVITARNEESIVCAALANKAGVNLVACHEAFAVKMLGAIRQELNFARLQYENGTAPSWLGVPVIATSLTWENDRHQYSHQDTTYCEVMMNEMNDVSRVLFPADWNSAISALEATYSSRGQIWSLIIPKQPLPNLFTREQSRLLTKHGAVRLKNYGREENAILLVATGGYQLREALRASRRLEYASVDHAVIYLQEPGRFRIPRDAREMTVMTSKEVIGQLFPPSANVRIFLTHTRPEPFIGTVLPLLSNVTQTPVLGFNNHGGTLNVDGMLFANRCTWAHAVAAAAIGMGELPESLLNEEEFAALAGMGDPKVLFDPQFH